MSLVPNDRVIVIGTAGEFDLESGMLDAAALLPQALDPAFQSIGLGEIPL